MPRAPRGFSLVEMAIAMTIMLLVTASVFAVMHPSQGTFVSQAEVADMQQRLRVAADMIYKDLVVAGAGPFAGGASGPLTDTLASILPYRSGETNPDPPGTYTSDTISILSVPRNGGAPSSVSYSLKTDEVAGTYQLMRYGGGSGPTVPVVDNVVALSFEYYGDPQPPRMRKPLSAATGPWTTYGPPPSATAVPPFGAGENCVFASDGTPTPQPRLATLGETGASLVKLTAGQFADGPWCPDEGSPVRWDADLLRIRTVAVVLRVQAAAVFLRGPLGALFTRGGTSRGGPQWLPDQEIRFDVSPRNLNLHR